MPIPLASVVGIQALTMAIAERKRAQSDFELRKYPGGKFDVLGLADKLDLEDMKKKEIAKVLAAVEAGAARELPVEDWRKPVQDRHNQSKTGAARGLHRRGRVAASH